jgi:CheY-like chemotaxis protein
MTVRTWADDDWVFTAVSDDGDGGEASRPLSGQPLFATPSGLRQVELDQVRRSVEALGGRLLFESRPGVWTRATLVLRRERRRAHRRRSDRAAPAPTVCRHGGLCVLVVDDNAALRSVLRRYLERRGHSVAEACDGVEGLDLLRGRTFDRVIVDVQMPRKDGTEFFEELRRLDPTLQARTIFITGGFLSDAAERVIRESGRPSVRKPFDLAEMAATIER